MHHTWASSPAALVRRYHRSVNALHDGYHEMASLLPAAGRTTMLAGCCQPCKPAAPSCWHQHAVCPVPFHRLLYHWGCNGCIGPCILLLGVVPPCWCAAANFSGLLHSAAGHSPLQLLTHNTMTSRNSLRQVPPLWCAAANPRSLLHPAAGRTFPAIRDRQ
jgi:hypothetical protein